MDELMKQIYSGKIKNRIRILNCPHCQSVLVPSRDRDCFEYKCFECDVVWETKLKT